ncbi:porin family protein [Flavicella marina]|uniref:outer membrane beta-barrel protein n=1 Tax=Flavicella marina TaxID=1475951 RepID=UPI0012658663|nr:outer membrane beta-barrel protein [Flavicella marina]
MKIRTLLLALFTAAFSFAQNTETVTTTTTTTTRTYQLNQDEFGFAKDNIYISGGVSFNSINSGSDESNKDTFELTTKFGGFLSDNFSLGLNILVSSAPFTIYATYYTLKTFEIGLLSRYYFNKKSKFSIYLEGLVNKNFSTLEYETIDYYSSSYGTTKTTKNEAEGYRIAFSPGINYFLNKHFALEASWGILSYETSKSDEENAESRSAFSVGLGFENINFSLLYKF